jgi:hypothetical protein
VFYNQYRCQTGLTGATPAHRSGAPALPPARFDSYRWRQHCNGLFQTPAAACVGIRDRPAQPHPRRACGSAPSLLTQNQDFSLESRLRPQARPNDEQQLGQKRDHRAFKYHNRFRASRRIRFSVGTAAPAGLASNCPVPTWRSFPCST